MFGKQKKIVSRFYRIEQGLSLQYHYLSTCYFNQTILFLSRSPTIKFGCCGVPPKFNEEERRKNLLNEVDRLLEEKNPLHVTTGYTSFGADVVGGRIYHNPMKPLKDPNVLIAKGSTIGPGEYNPENADKLIRKSQPRTIAFHLQQCFTSQSKRTPQQERRKYWEDKANEAREEHDDLKVTSDKLIRPRIISTNIQSDAKINTGCSGYGKDEKGSKVDCVLKSRRLQEKQYNCGGVGQYHINYNATEINSHNVVSMSQQVAAQKSTIAMISKRPGVARAIAERKRDDTARGDRFLGPQLPVQWAAPRDICSHAKKDFIFENTLRTLSRGDEAEKTKLNQLEDPFTSAFLQSSYTVAPRHKTVTIRPPTPLSQRFSGVETSALIAAANRDFIGPQLPRDWAAEARKRENLIKGLALDMYKNLGRDKINIKQKGEIDVKGFNDLIERPEILTSPELDQITARSGNGKLFLQSPKGFVNFASAIGRHDVVGPRGERPAGASVDIEKVITDVNWADGLDSGFLELDVNQAKDNLKTDMRKLGINLGDNRYYEDRDKDDDADAGRDHIGGTWFKGLAEEMAKKRPVIDFKKLQGRESKDEGLESLDDEDDHLVSKRVSEGAVLKLEVKNEHPHKARTVYPPAWSHQDKKSNAMFIARFAEDEKTEHEAMRPLLSPNYEFVRPRSLTDRIHIDMSKLPGRDGRNHEETIFLDEMAAVPDSDIIRRVLIEKEAALIQVSAQKVKSVVEMEKMQGRIDKDIVSTEKYKDAIYDVESAAKALRNGVNIGTQWTKSVGRPSDQGEINCLDGEDADLVHRNELMLDVKMHGVYKRGPQLVSWDRNTS